MSIQELLKALRGSLIASEDDFTLAQEVGLYRRRADVALGEERYNDALVFLAKILRLDPNDLSARMAVAETYHHRLHDPVKALVTYEKVVASAGYDESNPFCAAARQGISELSAQSDPASSCPDLSDLADAAEGAGR